MATPPPPASRPPAARSAPGCPRPRGSSTAIVPPRASTILRAMARPRPVPVRLVVKYGSNTWGRSAAAIPVPRSATHSRTRRGSRRRAPTSTSSAPAGLRRGRAARPRCPARSSTRFTSTARRRSASVTSGPGGGVQGEAGPDRAVRPEPGVGGLAAEVGEVGRGARSTLSGPGEVQDVADDPVEPRHLVVDVAWPPPAPPSGRASARLSAAQRPLDDHERVADLVGDHRGEPAEGREPLPQGRFASGSGRSSPVRVSKVRARSRASSSSHGPPGADLAREVAGGRHRLHAVGERGQRPRHRPRHRGSSGAGSPPRPGARRRGGPCAGSAAAAGPRSGSAGRGRAGAPPRPRAAGGGRRTPRPPRSRRATPDPARGREQRGVLGAGQGRGVEAAAPGQGHVAVRQAPEPAREGVVEREAEGRGGRAPPTPPPRAGSAP